MMEHSHAADCDYQGLIPYLRKRQSGSAKAERPCVPSSDAASVWGATADPSAGDPQSTDDDVLPLIPLVL